MIISPPENTSAESWGHVSALENVGRDVLSVSALSMLANAAAHIAGLEVKLAKALEAVTHYKREAEHMKLAASEGARVSAEIERERCAKIAEESALHWRADVNNNGPGGGWATDEIEARRAEAEYIAAAIRKGGET